MLVLAPVTGAAAEKVPWEHFSDYTAVHPVAELVILPETGHHTPIEPGAQASTR
ncbi:hypothetical protein [Streptomyces canus]|uniref:hypothetical protein n=1 Tax=Streptomyces canus TaxID=58343 RepID=UPI002E25ECE2